MVSMLALIVNFQVRTDCKTQGGGRGGAGGGLPYERGGEARVDISENGILGLVPRKMVKFNPGLSQVLSKVFLSKNM